MKYLAFVIVAFCISLQSFSQIGRGTSVLFLVRKDTVSLIADSKRFYNTPQGTKIETVQKIENVGETFFFTAVNAVLVSLNNPKDTLFHAHKLMRSILMKSPHIDIDKCFSAYTDSVVRILNLLMKDDINKKFFLKGYDFLQAGMVQFKNGVPKVCVYHYGVDTGVYKIVFRMHLPPPGTKYPFLGGIGKWHIARKNFIEGRVSASTDIELMRKLIWTEMENAPNAIGEPMNAVSIYQGGHKWYPPYYYSKTKE